MTYGALRERIKKQSFDPAYFLHGDNQFLINELAGKITSAIVARGFATFDRSLLYGDEVDAAGFLNAVETPPMASAKKVVVLAGVDRLSERLRRTLLEYLERPAPTTVLVTTAPKVDMKKSFFRKLASRTRSVYLRNLRESETVDWIRERVASFDRSIDSDGAAMLHNSIGDDQSYLANEIDKLIMCAGERKRITADDVAAVAGKSRANSIFELTDAIGRLDYYRSVTLVNNLLAWGQKPTAILAFILRHMLILLGLKALVRRDSSREEMCKRFRLLPYYLGGYLKQAHKFTEPGLRERIRLIQASESRLKSSGSVKSFELESLMYNLCRKDADRNG